ncbi:hypothetical protein [Streptomyces sp. SLBN-118]|uniref:hypothetical protein n=1 Tax=Streptomyces sp. SLBN-118 TaxID=2768454 RepID=UPI001151FA0E|nr:hypothetical protein [Streptomyces sp. SLBN-118]
MTAAAACSAAVLRVLRRAAAGRRALRVMLFLGGLLTLGLLCGGQAHAAELPEPTAATEMAAMPANARVSVAPSPQQAPVRELRSAGRSAQPVRVVAQPVVGTVRPFVRPVIHRLTERLGALTAQALPAHALPGPLPVPLTPAGSDADRMGGPQPVLGRPASVEPGGSSRAATVSTRGQLGSYDTGPDRLRAEARPERPVTAPAQVPGEPCHSVPGALQQSAETHTPRTGDQQAATGAYDRSLALAPDTCGSSADAPTRERPRDILEFPG